MWCFSNSYTASATEMTLNTPAVLAPATNKMAQKMDFPLTDWSPRLQKLKKEFRLSSPTPSFTDVLSEGMGPIQGQPQGQS